MTPAALHENMTMHLIYTHGRTLDEVTGRTYDDLKAEHDGLACPPVTTTARRAKDALTTATTRLRELDTHQRDFDGWTAAAQDAHLAGQDAHGDHWMHDDDRAAAGPAADAHRAEHAAEVRQALHDVAAAQDRATRPAATPLAEVLADARAEGLVWESPTAGPAFGGSGEPGTSADGWVHLMLIFADEDGRRRFCRRWARSWVTTADRSCFLDYENTWTDVQGPGLVLSTYCRDRNGQDRTAR